MSKRPVRFTFDGETFYHGLTDDTRWNGFLNVWVTEETHCVVLEDLTIDAKLDGQDIEESLGGLDELLPGEDGLISYSYGFCTVEEEEG